MSGIVELEIRQRKNGSSHQNNNDDIKDYNSGGISSGIDLDDINDAEMSPFIRENMSNTDESCKWFNTHCTCFYPCYQVKRSLWYYHSTHLGIGLFNLLAVTCFFTFLYDKEPYGEETRIIHGFIIFKGVLSVPLMLVTPISWSLRLCVPPKMPALTRGIWNCCGNIFGSREGRYHWEILVVLCNCANVAIWINEVAFIRVMYVVYWENRWNYILGFVSTIVFSILANIGSFWGVYYRLYMGTKFLSESISWKNNKYKYELHGYEETSVQDFTKNYANDARGNKYRYESLSPQKPICEVIMNWAWETFLRFPLFFASVMVFNVVFGLYIPLFWIFYWFIVNLCCCLPCSKRIYREKVRSGTWLWYICNVKVIPCCCIIRWLRCMLECDVSQYYITHMAIWFFTRRIHTIVGDETWCKWCIFGCNCNRMSVTGFPAYNLVHDYSSYSVFYDDAATTTSRLLPMNVDLRIRLENDPNTKVDNIVKKLFNREEFIPETNVGLNVLTAIYARWFTHQFTATDLSSKNWTKNKQPCGMNLMQLYGSKPEIMDKLRDPNHQEYPGELRSTYINGEEFPFITDDEKTGEKVFLASLDNVQKRPFFHAINILFHRHHNYVVRSLKHDDAFNQKVKDLQKYNDSQANDDRNDNYYSDYLYETAKMVNIVTMYRLTLSTYVSMGIIGTNFDVDFKILDMDRLFDSWMYHLVAPKIYHAANIIFQEFNLMYRWHQMIPDQIHIIKDLPNDGELNTRYKVYKRGKSKYDRGTIKRLKELTNSNKNTLYLSMRDMQTDKWNSVNILTAKDGLERVILSTSYQEAGMISLCNTNKELMGFADKQALEGGRKWALKSFNEYRLKNGFERYTKFEQINEDPKIVNKLKEIYKSVDDIEFFVGLWAENKDGYQIHGPFESYMFGGLVFMVLNSNRIIRRDLKKSLTPLGEQLAYKINSLAEFVELHTKLYKENISYRAYPNIKI